MPRPATARHSAPVRAAKPQPEAVPKDPEEPSVTNDVSRGKPRIMVESQVLEHLRPKGVSVEMQRNLADASLDALSLDGTYSNDVFEDERNGDLAI
jgi:hypothetical protein